MALIIEWGIKVELDSYDVYSFINEIRSQKGQFGWT